MSVSHLLFISNLFSSDMVIIIVVALFLFGGEKLPEIARGLGKGIRDFKDASEGIKREINEQINSFEEKKAEEALNKKAEQIQTTAYIEAETPTHPVVENTISVGDYNFNAGAHNEPVINTESHAEPVAHSESHSEMATENHAAVGHRTETDI